MDEALSSRKALVLDKSSLEAMPPDSLYCADREHHLILTIELFEEIQDSTRSNKGQIAKLMAATRDQWVPQSMRLMAWELENNFSSRILLFEKHKANLYTKTPAPVLEFLRRDISRVAYEKSNPKSAMFMETARRGMSPAEFFPFLRRMCALNIALATNHFVDLATAWDLRLNPHFHLRAGMFCSGLCWQRRDSTA